MHSATLRAAVFALAGCAAAKVPASVSVAPAGLAPRPFTAGQIRDAMPSGTEIRYRMEAEGQPTAVSRGTVAASDASGCTIHTTVLGEDGALISDEGKKTSTWIELMEHATFPAEATVRTDASTTVPAGTFDTWLYQVRRGTGASAGKIERFYFAKRLPGPPVLLVVEDGGRVVMRMTLLSRK